MSGPAGHGMPHPGRSGGEYRYGWQGMERDTSIVAGGYATPLREYDARLARWMSVDPVTHGWESPYMAMSGNPINLSDGSGGDTARIEGGDKPPTVRPDGKPLESGDEWMSSSGRHHGFVINPSTGNGGWVSRSSVYVAEKKMGFWERVGNALRGGLNSNAADPEEAARNEAYLSQVIEDRSNRDQARYDQNDRKRSQRNYTVWNTPGYVFEDFITLGVESTDPTFATERAPNIIHSNPGFAYIPVFSTAQALIDIRKNGLNVGNGTDLLFSVIPGGKGGKAASRTGVQIIEHSDDIIRVTAKGRHHALIKMEEEVLEIATSQEVRGTYETVAGFKIFGNKGVVGQDFTRNILLIEALEKGNTPLRALANSLEAEARAAGAKILNIGGYGVMNDGFLNPKILQRYGFQFEQINKTTIRIWKEIK